MPRLQKLLNLDQWVCNFDGRPLSFNFRLTRKFPFLHYDGYLKLAMWTQYPYLTPTWYFRSLLGNNRVLRFHNEECFMGFAQAGRMIELEAQKH